MSVLQKSKHEQFALAVARGESPAAAYTSAFGSAKGAAQSASRLLRNANISSRISELQLRIAEKQLKLAITDRNFRLEQLQKRLDLLNQVIAERGTALGGLNINGYPLSKPAFPEAAGGAADSDDRDDDTPAPGAGTGLVCLDWRGKDAVRAVWKVDTGLLAELRAIEEQAARECGQWMDKSELTIKDGDLAARLAAGRDRVAKARG